MRELIGTYGKSAVFGAGGGFLLSLLVGVVSGNPFAVVLVRAFLFLILFAGLAAGAQALIGRFLPELSAPVVADEEGPRRTVDITLPEENPHAESPGVRISETDGEDPADAPGDAEDVADVGDVGDVDGDGAAQPSPAEELAGAVDGSAPAAESSVAATGGGGSRAGDAREGSLPDLDQLGASFGSGQSGRSVPQARVRAGDGSGLAGEDPAVLARAIRTAIKKDEKG